MFNSRETTRCDQKEMIWDDRVAFLLSLSLKEGTAGEIKETISKSTVLITAMAEKETSEPCFGPQAYFDAKEGFSYRLEIPEADRYLAIYQHKDWWVRPAFFTEITCMPDRTQLLLFRIEDTYFAVLSVCGEECRTDMCGTDKGITVRVSSNAGNRNRINEISLVIAAEKNPYLSCEKAVKTALGSLGKSSMYREARHYPELFESFGWCTWDAFYHCVSHDRIMEKMKEFEEKQLPVKWVLIDDGWLDADYDKKVLRSLSSENERFPKGLKGCVKELKEKWNICSVGVWHAVMGYWNGLEERSSAAEKLKYGVGVLPDGRLLPKPQEGKAFGFFDTWHEYLKNGCGIDFVKVDGQSSISLAYRGMESFGKASREIQKGLNASVALHFNNCIINCMGMASEDMWNRPSSAVSRSSDDFVPEVPHGFREHAIQNSYNSLLQGQFFWGDWDMFFSEHEENWQNSVLRAVSGGPVYVSDRTGETNPDYIWPLISKAGRVFRCEEVGMPTTDCLFENPEDTLHPLKIFNRFGENYVVGAFHICRDEENCRGKLNISDIPALSGQDWLVYDYKAQTVSRLGTEGITFELLAGGAALFLFVPNRNRGRLIGILEKYISCGCCQILNEDENRMTAMISESGTLGISVDKSPTRVLVNGKEMETVYRGDLLRTVVLERPDCLVEIEW